MECLVCRGRAEGRGLDDGSNGGSGVDEAECFVECREE